MFKKLLCLGMAFAFAVSGLFALGKGNPNDNDETGEGVMFLSLDELDLI